MAYRLRSILGLAWSRPEPPCVSEHLRGLPSSQHQAHQPATGTVSAVFSFVRQWAGTGALHMRQTVKSLSWLIWFGLLASFASAQQAPSADLAKKCRALAVKAHPTRPAGARTGIERAQRSYFQDCIAKGGNVQN